MNQLKQLDQIRRQMVEELTQIPQYRALKIMERMIADLSAIYEASPGVSDPEISSDTRTIADTIEKHKRNEPSPLIVKNTAYKPVQQVA
jgi:hypothetical protein